MSASTLPGCPGRTEGRGLEANAAETVGPCIPSLGLVDGVLELLEVGEEGEDVGEEALGVYVGDAGHLQLKVHVIIPRQEPFNMVKTRFKCKATYPLSNYQ